MRLELMYGSRIRLDHFVSSRTSERDQFVAPLVHHKRADPALKALFAEAPNEIATVTAKGWLLEESGDELVLLDHKHVLLLESSLPASDQFIEELVVFLFTRVRHCWPTLIANQLVGNADNTKTLFESNTD